MSGRKKMPWASCRALSIAEAPAFQMEAGPNRSASPPSSQPCNHHQVPGAGGPYSVTRRPRPEVIRKTQQNFAFSPQIWGKSVHNSRTVL